MPPLTGDALVLDNQKKAADMGIAIPGVGGSKAPAGWDTGTYYNFKTANPGLEPTAQDTAQMQKTTPTIISNANIADKKIPEIKNRADKALAQTQSQTQPRGDQTQGGTNQEQPDLTTGYEDIYDSILGSNKTSSTEDPFYKSQLALIDKMSANSDATTRAYLEGIKGQYATQQRQLTRSNANTEAGLGTALLRSGTARYAPGSAAGLVSAQHATGIQKMADLTTQENAAIAEANQAKLNSDYKLLDSRLSILGDIRKEKMSIAKDIFEQKAAEEKANRDAEIKVKESVSKIAQDAAENGATPEQIDAITNSESVGDAIANAGDSLQKGTGTVGEWLQHKKDMVSRGLIPLSFDEYANMDANRKRSIVNVGIGGDSGYTSKQVTAITRLNDSISKNATYTKTSSMRNYGDNVKASLSQGTGVGDIAAINQFQKVIDEGAVTRDQDVKLIQGAQSLANQLKTKVAKLEKGEQLSQTQRDQMQKLVDDMYASQVKALEKDPYISAKKKEAELYGLSKDDTILGELSGFNIGQDIMQSEEQARKQLVELALKDPKIEAAVNGLAGVPQPNLPGGRAYTWAEILDEINK